MIISTPLLIDRLMTSSAAAQPAGLPRKHTRSSPDADKSIHKGSTSTVLASNAVVERTLRSQSATAMSSCNL